MREWLVYWFLFPFSPEDSVRRSSRESSSCQAIFMKQA